MTTIFAFVGVYFMPLIGFLFIVTLFKGIEKIIKSESYTAEVIWCGIFFAIIVWTICMLIFMTDG